MTDAPRSNYLYVTYIKTSAERLWEALTSTEFTAQYWLGARVEADWRVGGEWKLAFSDGRLADAGEVLDYDPPHRLAIRWRNHWSPELNAEGWSRCTMEVEPQGEVMKLTVTHSIDVADSKLIVAVSGGWPKILSNLKSLLETGTAPMPPKQI